MLDRMKAWLWPPAPAKQIAVEPPMVVEGAGEIMAFIVRDVFVNGDAAYEVSKDGTLRRIDLNTNSED